MKLPNDAMHFRSLKDAGIGRDGTFLARQFRPSRSLPLLVLGFSLAMTWLLWSAERQQTAKELQDYFNFRVRQAHLLTEQRVLAQEQVLRGVQGLFAASGKVERKEFHDYISSLHLDENYPGIQGVGFSMIVPPVEKNRHITSVRKESGHPGYLIRPEGERDFYTSIVYLEPFSGLNLRAFGYDMYSETVRRAAMELARDSGRASLSGKVKLVQETGKNVQAGFLMYLPVYRSGAPQGTVQERRNSIIGWVYSPFRMNDLAHGMYGERADDLHIEIYDGATTSPDALMYGSSADIQRGNTVAAMSSIQQLNVADHIWTLAVHPLPVLESRVDRDKPALIASGGIGASLLLAVLTWLLVSGHSRALAYAREMNRELIESEQALHDSEEKLQAILNAAEVAIAWANEAGEIEYVNPKFISLFGYTLAEVPTVEQWYLHAYPEEEYREKAVAEWSQKVARSLPGKTAIEPMEVTVCCKDGSVRHLLLMGSWAGTRLLANFSDITARKNAEMALLEALQKANRFADALDDIPSYIYMKDRDRRYFYANKFTLSLFKCSAEELSGSADARFFSPEVVARLKAIDDRVLEYGETTMEEIEIAPGTPEWRVYWEVKRPIYDETGKIYGLCGISTDITERKQNERMAQRMASYDALTGLPNRMLLSDRLQQALATAKRDKAHLALIFIDLDKFKPVNDELGHHVGDLLLKEVAKRMQACVRESDTVARVGGDEFVVLLPFVEVAQDAILVAEKIRGALNQPFVLTSQMLSISSSSGIAVYPEHGKDETQLLRNADVAMYHAKQGGRNSVMLYHPEVPEQEQTGATSKIES